LFKERITTIKKREKQLIDGITKHSQKLQNEIELERKTVKKTFCDLKRQAGHLCLVFITSNVV
jgi:hypothetical protein